MAGAEFQPQQIEELRERVLKKLQRLKQRHEQDKAEEA